jgi:hypothetical protein
MNAVFIKEGWDALMHGAVAGALVLVLNGIGHYVFEAPDIPFAYGLTAVTVIVVAAIRLFAHTHDGSSHGA